MRIAIYGGSFDPPHLAHLFTITYLLSRSDVDEVWLLPAANHVFGKVMTPFKTRVSLLELVIAPFDNQVQICQIEAERDGQSRTFDTLSILASNHPEHRFTLVIGADNLTESHRWHRFDELVARWPVIVLGRPGHEAALAARADEPWCHPGPTLPDISSSRIRAALQGQGVRQDLAWIPEVIQTQVQALYPQKEAPKIPPVWIFGAGRAGRAWLSSLRRAGVQIGGVWNRSPSKWATITGELPDTIPSPGICLLTVSDPAIEPLAERLSTQIGHGHTVLHCAGRYGAHVLASLAAQGAKVGSLHPLQSLQGLSADELVGSFCGIEGEPEAARVARELARVVGARPIEIPLGEKAAYHAAAVFSANFATTLAAGGIALLTDLQIAEPSARAMLIPLLRGTVDSLESRPAFEALTGPFARRDLAAIEAHLGALRQHAPLFLRAYCELAQTTARWLGWPDQLQADLATVIAAFEP